MITGIWSITLTVANLERSVYFYENILELPKKYVYGDYAGFACGPVEIGLKTWGECEKPRKGEPCIDLLVHNIDASYNQLLSRGVEFITTPHDAAWGARIASFHDPDHHELQLTQVIWPKYFAVTAPGS
jgi:catechol 2,3-dioxygenase-like lactoylglutathione lyase family enzyme